MATYSIIKLSQLEGAHRLDAEYYQPEYLENDKVIKNYRNGFGLLGEVLKRRNGITGGATPLGANYLNSGIPFLRVQNVMQNYLDLSDVVYISEDIHKGLLRRSRLKPGDVLLTITGVSYGKSTTIPHDFKEGNINQHSVKIEIDDSVILPEFLSTFLNSRLGKYQNDRKITGLSRPGLVYTELKNILIPLVDLERQREVKRLVEEANDVLKKSESFYIEAEELLLEELGLKDFKIDEDLSYSVNLSDIKNAHRADAEYFQPKYERIKEKIKNYKNGYGQLLDFVENIKPNFDPRKYPQKTFSYIELSDINTSIGAIQSSNNIIGEEAPSRARRILKKNDVIVSSVEGSLEKVALVNNDFEGSLASTGFFQFRPKNITPETLLILSKSLVIQNQLKKECAGTILTAVTKEALSKLIIPILPQENQQKIATLVQQSHEARKKAKELLKEAKKRVETLIEGKEA